MNKKTIGIIGLGLIGGSLGLDLQNEGYRVLGVSRKQETCDIALFKGVCAESSIDFKLLEEAEIIFLATPISSIVSSLEKLIPHLNSQAIVTDVASVKKIIVEQCSNLWPGFIGGHPMAGTAEQGINSAQFGLFRNAPYVLTPTERTLPEAVKSLKEIILAIGAKLFIANPQEHDGAVAWISHLPVIISAALLQGILIEAPENIKHLAQNLASSGFRDTSRVGGGNPELGAMMAKYNKQALLRSVSGYQDTLKMMIELIEKENWAGLTEILENTQSTRPKFLKE